MVQDLTGLPVKKIGFLAGFLTTAFFLGQLLGTFGIGRLSDTIGRKPVLVFGLVANCVCSLGFGFSLNMPMAVAFRFINGLFNGSIGVVKAYVRESTSPRHQATAFGIRSAGYSIGTILGPLVGGTLSRPYVQYPNVFEGNSGLFLSFPFLLPCLVAVGVNVISIVLTILLMPETVEQTKNWKVVLINASRCCCRRQRAQQEATVEIELETLDEGSLEAQQPVQRDAASGWGTTVRLVKEKNILLIMLLYAGIGLGDISFVESFALWAILSPLDNYLGFREVHIGLVNGVCAVFVLFWQMVVYPKLDLRFGTLRILRATFVMLVPTAIAYPYLRFMRPELPCFLPLEHCATRALHTDGLVPPPWTFSLVFFWFVMLTSAIVMRILFVQAYTAVNLSIANMAPSNLVGATNGLSATFAAASRCTAPVLAGTLFAASLHLGIWPIDSSLTFLLVGLLNAGLFLATLRLDESVNVRRSTPLH